MNIFYYNIYFLRHTVFTTSNLSHKAKTKLGLITQTSNDSMKIETPPFQKG